MESKPQLEDLIGIEHIKLGFFRDVKEKIEELQASNLELERRRRQIQAILDGITDVMAVVSLDFRVVSVNRVFHELYGPAEPGGDFCFRVFRHRDSPCADCPLPVARDENRVCRTLMIYSVDGAKRHFEVTASPLRGTDGKPANILILKRDVTLEKEYQAKYYQAEKMATIGVLAAGVAHEINNPLMAIQGFAEGLRRRLSNLEKIAPGDAGAEMKEDFAEYTETILEECRRCRDIVNSLLTFGPREQNEFGPVDLNAAVRNSLKLLEHRTKRLKEGRLRVELEEGLEPASGDAAEIKQVILNLVLNALDAVQDGGGVVVRTSSSGGGGAGPILEVEDSGPGILREHLDKLFDPFFTTKPAGQGTGIGLSTCYHIIQRHGGEIQVASEEGEGARFTVEIPRYGQ